MSTALPPLLVSLNRHIIPKSPPNHLVQKQTSRLQILPDKTPSSILYLLPALQSCNLSIKKLSHSYLKYKKLMAMNPNPNLPLLRSFPACVDVDVDFGILFLRLVVLSEISKILVYFIAKYRYVFVFIILVDFYFHFSVGFVFNYQLYLRAHLAHL